MIYIQHRVNSIDALKTLAPQLGVEIDIRSDLLNPGELHLSHDPWVRGDRFSDWLDVYKDKGFQGPIILNTKEDGLESRVLQLLQENKIENFFFLDTAAPTLVRWSIREKLKKFAVRLSAYEPVAALEAFRGAAEWIWVDCFDTIPLPASTLDNLKPDFKICLVSPELQGGSLDQISPFRNLLARADAVCTKQPERWIIQ